MKKLVQSIWNDEELVIESIDIKFYCLIIQANCYDTSKPHSGCGAGDNTSLHSSSCAVN